MKNKKSFKLILLILILVTTYIIVQNTYSKYLTKTDNHSTLNISKWNILLNNKNISDNAVFSENVKVSYYPNNNIAQNVIVPTSKGYFDLSLDSTGTDLPFSYEIKIGKIPPCYITLNNITFDSETSSYLHDIHITITNSFQKDTFYLRNFSFEFPEAEIQNAKCDALESLDNQNFSTTSFEGFFSNTADNPGIELNSDESISFNVILYSKNEIKNFEATNIKLNNLLVDDFLSEWHPDFRMTSYGFKDVGYPVSITENSIKGNVFPPENLSDSVINNFTIQVEWYDNSNNMLNNFSDVAISKKLQTATLPVIVIIKQLTPQN